jgi:hypothetical protein
MEYVGGAGVVVAGGSAARCVRRSVTKLRFRRGCSAAGSRCAVSRYDTRAAHRRVGARSPSPDGTRRVGEFRVMQQFTATVRCWQCGVDRVTESSSTVSSETPAPAVSPPRVFISYAHDSEAHCEQVRALWIFLRSAGIDARSDVDAAEKRQNWPLWMEKQVSDADRILVVASSGYRKCLESKGGQQKRRGVQYEAEAICRRYNDADPDDLSRVLPVVLPGGSVDDVPAFLRPEDTTVYEISAFTVKGAESLLRVLHDRPRDIEPAIGEVPYLPTRDNIPASGILSPSRILRQRSERAGQSRPVRARHFAVVVIVAVIALATTIVGLQIRPAPSSGPAGSASGENPPAPAPVSPSSVPSLPVFVPQVQVKVDSPTLDAMNGRHRIRIATKTTKRGIVDRKPSADSAGFDAGIQELVAAGLGFSAGQIDPNAAKLES